jgi:hydrogenase maturation protease
MKTIVIGLGNPILGDDGIGWRVVEMLVPHLPAGSAAPVVECLALGGLSLMERLIGYERAIIVDAILTHQHPIGAVTTFPLQDLPNRAIGHLSSAHDTTLQNALEVGRSYGASLPQLIDIVAIEAGNVYDFSESLSAPVAAAAPLAVDRVLTLLNDEREEG